MNNVKVWCLMLMAFVSGAFIASSDLRAYAANTIFSGDIVDGEVKTADLANNAVTSAKIKNGEVKTADIGGSAVTSSKIASNAVSNGKIAADAVTSAKIADNTIVKADVSPSFMKFGQLLDDATGNAAGWNPGPGPENYVISETAITSQSTVNLTIDDSGNVNCEVTDLNPGVSFELWCGLSLPTEGATLNYQIINP